MAGIGRRCRAKSTVLRRIGTTRRERFVSIKLRSAVQVPRTEPQLAQQAGESTASWPRMMMLAD
jgi:hypothetical protein